MVALAVRHHYPLSVISLDLDYFKHTNEALGHAAGDQFLVKPLRASPLSCWKVM